MSLKSHHGVGLRESGGWMWLGAVWHAFSSSLAGAEGDVNTMSGTDLSLRGCPC